MSFETYLVLVASLFDEGFRGMLGKGILEGHTIREWYMLYQSGGYDETDAFLMDFETIGT